MNLENFSVVVAAIELRISPVAVEVIALVALNVVNAPADPSKAGAPVEPLLTAKAVAMPVPRPETPVLMGRPVQLDSVPL